ncbi:MAG: hypothetical protein V2A34_07400 [Lentisphaerota bacterium]
MQTGVAKWARGWPVLLALVFAVGLFMSACENGSSSDSNNSGGTNNVSPLIGAWTLTSVATDGTVWTPEQTGWTMQLSFKQDNTYTGVQTSQGVPVEFSGAYATSGSQITMENSMSGSYTVTGAQLSIFSPDYDGLGTPGTLTFQRM